MPKSNTNSEKIFEKIMRILRPSKISASQKCLGDSIIKELKRYKGTWYKYIPNSFNFGINGDRA